MMVRTAEAVRNFHAVGWLHKGINSKNILFVPSATDTDNVFTSARAGPFLAGFGYSRAANVTEFSEIPLTSSEDDFYCHTAVVGPAPKCFRKLFDLYALGLVLLEIALWEKLSDILEGACEPDELTGHQDQLQLIAVRDRVLLRQEEGSVMRRLRDSCTSAVYNAVEICLSQRAEATWELFDNNLKLQNGVVDLLDLAIRTIDATTWSALNTTTEDSGD